ncbi:MAG: AAA family ATPase [Proteobacteria bacterium]|nr:AAA family ATPase [Pseudomonadota bacterium]
MSLNKYDPRLKKYDELDATFVCGRNFLNEILDELKTTNLDKASRQSWIIAGPRGAGKSHLLTLLYRKIKSDKNLNKIWQPLIFPEEIFKVDSLYRLLLSIFEKLLKGAGGEAVTGNLANRVIKIKKTKLSGSIKQKREQKTELARELLDLLTEASEKTGQKLILILENLQFLFRHQLSLDDQRVLRGYLHENPNVFIIIGSALTVFEEVENYGKPFYHFFRIRSMEQLGWGEIEQFLKKIAVYRKDSHIEERIDINRHHIYTYSILTGGNPRLILFLYELLLDQPTLNTGIILDKVAELTPYFLDKTRDESHQRKLILDALSNGAPAQTASEIAVEVNEDLRSISEQLKRLAAEGWVKEIPIVAKGVKNKETFFALRDYFFRIWYQIRSGDIDDSEVNCLAELVTLLFDREQILEKIKHQKDTSGSRIDIYERAYELAGNDSHSSAIKMLVTSSKKQEHTRIKEILQDVEALISDKDWYGLIKTAKKLEKYTDQRAKFHYYSGTAYYNLNQLSNCLEQLKEAVSIEPQFFQAWYDLGYNHYEKQEYSEAIHALRQYILNKPELEFSDYNQFFVMIECAEHLYSGTEELYHLLKKDELMEKKLESIERLVLLGRFLTVEKDFETILNYESLNQEDVKYLDYCLEGYILNSLKNGKTEGELNQTMRWWLKLLIRSRKDFEPFVKKRFLLFFLYYTKMVRKERLSIEFLKRGINDFLNEDIDISTILLELLSAITDPDSRNAQKWMVDPLFKEIVTRLS